MNGSDEALIVAHRQGDPAAFDELRKRRREPRMISLDQNDDCYGSDCGPLSSSTAVATDETSDPARARAVGEGGPDNQERRR